VVIARASQLGLDADLAGGRLIDASFGRSCAGRLSCPRVRGWQRTSPTAEAPLDGAASRDFVLDWQKRQMEGGWAGPWPDRPSSAKYYYSVRLPLANAVVGGINIGWKTAMATARYGAG